MRSPDETGGDETEFEEFADRQRQAVWNEVLEPIRRQRGRPEIAEKLF
jgi:hypothetical protein